LPTARLIPGVFSTPAIWLGSFLAGFAFHSIHGVGDPRTFWVGNLSWPYVLVPALACVGTRTLGRAVARSVGSAVCMVLGFYNVPGLVTVSATSLGLEPDTPWHTVFATAVRNDLDLLVLGRPGGTPWITVAVVTGVALATFHHLAGRHRGRAAFWAIVGLLGVLEPAVHFAPFLSGLPFGGYRFDRTGLMITVTECALGLSALAYALTSAHATDTRKEPTSGVDVGSYW
jgi:hypothetical protein